MFRGEEVLTGALTQARCSGLLQGAAKYTCSDVSEECATFIFSVTVFGSD